MPARRFYNVDRMNACFVRELMTREISIRQHRDDEIVLPFLSA
jgi:hypothetical protein